jgi:hypothetical protein
MHSASSGRNPSSSACVRSVPELALSPRSRTGVVAEEPKGRSHTERFQVKRLPEVWATAISTATVRFRCGYWNWIGRSNFPRLGSGSATGFGSGRSSGRRSGFRDSSSGLRRAKRRQALRSRRFRSRSWARSSSRSCRSRAFSSSVANPGSFVQRRIVRSSTPSARAAARRVEPEASRRQGRTN